MDNLISVRERRSALARRVGGRRSRLLGVAAVGAVMAVTVACSSSSTSTTSDSSASQGSSSSGSGGVAEAQAATTAAMASPTKILQNVPLPTAPPTGKLGIFVGTSEPQDAQVGQTFALAIKSFGWSYKTFSYDPANPATLNSALTSALAQKPEMVGMSGTDQSLISASVLSAYAAAKVHIAIDGAAPCTTTDVIVGCTAGIAAYESAGKSLADWFIADSDGKGKALVESAPAYPVLVGVPTAFKAEVSRLCPGCSVKVIDVSLQQIESGQVPSAVVTAARSNPSYKYLIFDDGDFALGINSALSGAGLTGYKIAGHALTTVSAADLRAGTQSAWSADNGIMDGYLLADVAARISTNATGIELDENKPEQLLTHANIGNISVWNAPADALQQFEKLWKVPVTP